MVKKKVSKQFKKTNQFKLQLINPVFLNFL